MNKPLPARSMPARFADHTTNLIRNAWYVAALAADVTRDLQDRWLLGTNVLLYRRQDGTAVALQNRCAHRSFPLSKGRLEGDLVVCGYHGLTYQPDGACVKVPSLPQTPANIRIASFPLQERGPLLWIWPGDPALADPALIPNTSWLGAAGWTSVQGGFHMRSNYVAMHENLLDQTHFSYLHADSVGTPEYAAAPLRVREDGDRVMLFKELQNAEPPPIYGIPMGLTGRMVDRQSDSGFINPGLHVAHATIINRQPRTGEKAEYHVNICHIITPETQDSFHYWWFNSRDFAPDSQAASDYLRDASARAYQEDVDALAWVQDMVVRDQAAFVEASFATDRPGMLMRRTLLRLAQAEAAG